MTKVIAVTGGKGGTGKTLLAVNLAFILNEIGRTLLVDADVDNPCSKGFVKSKPTSREVVKELELERLKLTDLVISKVVRELADEVRRLRDEVNRLTAKPQTQIATIPILIGAVGKPLTEQQPSPYQPYSSQYSTPSQVTPVIPLEQGEKFKRTHERPSSVGKTGSKETVSKPVPIQIQAESDVEGVDERWRRWLEILF